MKKRENFPLGICRQWGHEACRVMNMPAHHLFFFLLVFHLISLSVYTGVYYLLNLLRIFLNLFSFFWIYPILFSFFLNFLKRGWWDQLINSPNGVASCDPSSLNYKMLCTLHLRPCRPFPCLPDCSMHPSGHIHGARSLPGPNWGTPCCFGACLWVPGWWCDLLAASWSSDFHTHG